MDDPIASLWPDPVTGLMRLLLLAVGVFGLVSGIRMIRRGVRSRRRWRQMQHESVTVLVPAWRPHWSVEQAWSWS